MAIEIERLNDSLEGEFRFRGKKRSFPFTLPGDMIQFRTVRDGRGFRLIADKIERADSYNLPFTPVKPQCNYFGICGGCRGQHIPYDHQFNIKKNQISEKMTGLGVPEPEFIPAKDLFHYRNRMDFVTERSEESGEIFIGLRGAGDFSKFVDIKECLIQKPEANKILKLFRNIINNYPDLVFSRSSRKGILKYLTIRFGIRSGLAVLTYNPENTWSDEERLNHDKFLKEFSEKLSFLNTELCSGFSTESRSGCIGITECFTETVESENSNTSERRAAYGSDTFTEEISGVPFTVPGDAFFQPNPKGFEVLLTRALEWIENIFLYNNDHAADHLLDLYCGAGVISSVIYHKLTLKNIIFKKISGYDFTETAVKRAPLHFSGIPSENLNFIRADLNNPPEDLMNNKFSLIIVDPPRAGLSAGLKKALNRFRPSPYIIYFSCNPKSQIADIAELGNSYKAVQSLLCDPYPHTPHLEQVVLLERYNF